MLLIAIVLLVYSYVNFKNAIYITSVILVLQTHLLSGIPGVRLFYIVALFQMLLFILNGEWIKSKNTHYPWLLILPCVFATLGYLYSSYRGICKPYGEIIVSSLCTFAYPILLYKEIRTKHDLRSFFNVFFIFWLVVGIYTIIELFTNTNIYSILVDQAGAAKGFYGGVEEKVRYGIRRCNSLFVFCSTLGMTSAFTFFIILYLRINKISFNKDIENILLFLMPICVFLCGTRSQFMVLAICLIPFVLTGKTYRTKISKVLTMIGVLAFFLFTNYWNQIFSSMLDNNLSGGSSLDMREGQLEICLFYIRNSPLWGWGKGFIIEYVMPYNPALYGAESIWFRQIVDYGYVGCVTYLSMCMAAFIWVWKYDKRFVFIPIAFVFGKTVSIVLGVEISFLYVTCIILQKIHTLYIAQIKAPVNVFVNIWEVLNNNQIVSE